MVQGSNDLLFWAEWASSHIEEEFQMSIRVRVINLERMPERMCLFRSQNPGMPIEPVAATDGALLVRDDLIHSGIIASGNVYTPGALGNALSHVTLWRQCVEASEAFHIAEDDAILHPDFAARASALLQSAGCWSVVFWGWNFDWPVRMHLAPGVGSVVLRFNQSDMRKQIGAFRASDVPARLVGLDSCAGICCYSVSPRGAALLLAQCLPIGNAAAPSVTQPGKSWPNTGLDVEMSRHHTAIGSLACLPPLAVTPNDHATSTVQVAPKRPRSKHGVRQPERL
jgi:glycosyl transferase, family 25